MSGRRRLTLRAGVFSLRLELRSLVTLTVLAAAAFAVLVASVASGEYSLGPGAVLEALFGAGEEGVHFVVFELRLPRALTAILTGAALGIAGAIFQDLSRNPLVAPEVMGVTAGATLAAVSVIVFGDTHSVAVVPLAALGGALGAGLLLYALAWRGGVRGYRLVLVGIGIAAFMQAGVSYVLTRGNLFEVSEAYVWLVGSLNDAAWTTVWPLAVTLAVLLPLALLVARHLAPLGLGDDVAIGLGVRTERVKVGMLAAAVGLSGVAVAAAGPIGFVGFVSPHIARRVANPASPQALLVLAGLTGALLVTAADLVGRLLFAPTEIPVGIVTSILAAPYFLFLLRRAARPEMAR